MRMHRHPAHAGRTIAALLLLGASVACRSRSATAALDLPASSDLARVGAPLTVDGPTMLRDYVGRSSAPNTYVRSGRFVYFINRDGAEDGQLWKTDGTPAGTVAVLPGTVPLNTRPLLSFRGELYLHSGNTIWKLDAAETGISPAFTATAFATDGLGRLTSEPVVWNDRIYMSMDRNGGGLELWKSDGTEAGTELVKELAPGADGASPGQLSPTPMGLFFLKREASGVSLWVTDGTDAGTRQLTQALHSFTLLEGNSTRANRPQQDANRRDCVIYAGGKAFFGASDGLSVDRLWVTDGTAAGTRQIMNTSINDLMNASGEMVALPGGVAFIVRGDGVHGYEVYFSDGTDAGTHMLEEIVPGSAYTGLYDIIAFDGEAYVIQYISGTDHESCALWKTTGGGQHIGLVTTHDSIGESFPTDIAFLDRLGDKLIFFSSGLWATDGTAAGTVQLVPMVAREKVLPDPYESYALLGERIIFKGYSGTGSDSWSFGLTTPPELTCPADLQVETLEATASATFAATAVDADPETSISYSHAPGSAFPLGETVVTVTATDLARNSSTCTFKVSVLAGDVTAPVPTCPADLRLEAAGPDGATANFTVTAADDRDPAPVITTSAASGSDFPLGETIVTATATDARGNSATCTFTVTVADTVAPELICRGTVETTAGSVPAVETLASATDAVSTPQLTLEPLAGAALASATTDVRVTAKDGAGNASTCTVTVRDARPTETFPGCGCRGFDAGATALLGGLFLLRRRRRDN